MKIKRVLAKYLNRQTASTEKTAQNAALVGFNKRKT